MNKFVKVMFGTTSGANSDYEYKLNEVNESGNWNPNAKSGKDFGGFNYCDEKCILRWLHRGDTLYDVELPPDAEVIKCPGTFTPDGIYRTNKIIVKNPVPLTEDVVMDLYKKSNIPEKTYHDVLAILAIRGFEKVCLELIKDKVNKDTIDEFLEDYIEFGKKDIKDNNYGLYEKYKNKLIEIKKELNK